MNSSRNRKSQQGCNAPPPGMKPLAGSVKTACGRLGIGHTKMWELIGAGLVDTATLDRRRIVIFASLEALLARNLERPK